MKNSKELPPSDEVEIQLDLFNFKKTFTLIHLKFKTKSKPKEQPLPEKNNIETKGLWWIVKKLFEHKVVEIILAWVILLLTFLYAH